METAAINPASLLQITPTPRLRAAAGAMCQHPTDRTGGWGDAVVEVKHCPRICIFLFRKLMSLVYRSCESIVLRGCAFCGQLAFQKTMIDF